MVAPPRSLLEIYVNEFQNTIESTRSKLERSIGLSPTVQHPIIEMVAIKIPKKISDRDLWVQLRQQSIEMLKLMRSASSFMHCYGKQVYKFAEQFRTATRLEQPINFYALIVISYGLCISSYAMSGICFAATRVDGTPKSHAFIEKYAAQLQHRRDRLEQYRVRLLLARAELDPQHHQPEAGGTTTSIVLGHPQMTLPIPHEEILGDGVLMITKYQSIITDAGI